MFSNLQPEGDDPAAIQSLEKALVFDLIITYLLYNYNEL